MPDVTDDRLPDSRKETQSGVFLMRLCMNSLLSAIQSMNTAAMAFVEIVWI